MKSVAIMTIQDFNLGNRLQNYALQEILKQHNLKVTTLRRGNPPCLKKRLKTFVKTVIHPLRRGRNSKYESFDRKIKKSRCYVGADVAPEGLEKQYDYFVAGSDQVWNPYFNIVGKSDLLFFARNEQKVSYAASFGVSQIPEECKSVFADNLRTFHGLSVREESGRMIIKELTNRESEVVLDPTLMFTANQWRKVERSTKLRPQGKYALVYALGNKNKLFSNSIDKMKNEGYTILDVFAKNLFGKDLAIGPSEFLYLIDNSEIVLTDSFHASVFSILFKKRFMTFPREGLDMSSRIVTLAESLGLSDYFDENGVLCIKDMGVYMDTDKKLELHRSKSHAYIAKNLQ